MSKGLPVSLVECKGDCRAYDCHARPGTTEPGCGACITCLHRVLEGVEAERDKAQAERDKAREGAHLLRQRVYETLQPAAERA